MMATTSTMRDAATEYAVRGVPVFAVYGIVNGRCECGRSTCENAGKHPHAALAPNGFHDASTDLATIRARWTQAPHANIGTPTTWCTVLDVDIRKGGDATIAEFERRHGPLPDTAEVLTGGGGRHLYFQPVPGLRSSAGRLGPGLDIRADGGYVLVPPSMHVSGRRYADEILHPLFETTMAPMPAWMVAMLMTPTNGGAAGHSETDWSALFAGAPEGQRHAGCTQLAGHLLGKRLAPAVVEAILVDYAARCRPPFDPADVRRIVRDLAAKDARKDIGTMVPISEPSTTTSNGPVARAAETLRVPSEGMIGIGRDFAELYAKYLEPPMAFFYFVFLAYFGNLIAKKVTLESELRPEPRLYVVLIGESADTRKSTALKTTDEFFRSLGPAWEPPVLYGVGSAEGIAAELKERSDLILQFDEFKAFVDKAKNEHSVALPMVTTLFERGDYDNRVKAERVSVRGASLSLVAACTSDTYATMFDQRFFAIGLLNRLWLVADRATARIPVPRMIPGLELEPLRDSVRRTLERLDEGYVANGLRPVPYRLTPGALAQFREWYEARKGSIFERRLDTYGHRLMVLLAATSGKTVIDEEVMGAVLTLLRYQLDARRECDPVDAENTIAAVEEKVRRALARGALKGRDLKRRTNYQRFGIWAWNTAVDNLVRAGEVERDVKADLFWLSSLLSSPQNEG